MVFLQFLIIFKIQFLWNYSKMKNHIATDIDISAQKLIFAKVFVLELLTKMLTANQISRIFKV